MKGNTNLKTIDTECPQPDWVTECIFYCFFSGTFRGTTVLYQFSLIRYLEASVFISFPLFSLKQSEFCSDKPKSGAKYGLPDSLAILSEMGEVTEGMMDAKVILNELVQIFLGNPGTCSLCKKVLIFISCKYHNRRAK